MIRNKMRIEIILYGSKVIALFTNWFAGWMCP